VAWKVVNVSEVRFALCHSVRSLGTPVARAARAFGVSRKTAYKWLGRFDLDASVLAMNDQSRRPHRSPRRVDDAVEARVLAVRDAHGWGPRKVHAVMRREASSPDDAKALPCLRTVANVLRRRGRLRATEPVDPPAVQRFERSTPNALWQLDHKGPVEVQRQRWMPLTVIDDHSRYLLSFRPMSDRTMASTFAVLWDLFGEVGLPESILCDNAFGTMGGGGAGAVAGLSWFDARLVRLGIRPVHGRPYHPQTQGKVEALHATAARELIHRHARRDRIEHFVADCETWRAVYNAKRPHEALDDAVPLSRWRPSERRRPAKLPTVEYDAGVATRQAFAPGLITWQGHRIRVGAGLIDERVSIEEAADGEVVIRYGFKQVRRLRPEQLTKERVV
jgi:transposase InsO family protein